MNKKKILVIDDSEDTTNKIKGCLGNKYEVICATTLNEGLRLSKKFCVNITLLDLDLPDSRGLETLKIYLSKFPSIPVVVITEKLTSHNTIDILNMGAQDFILKICMTEQCLHKIIFRVLELEEATHKVDKLSDIIEKRTEEIEKAAELALQVAKVQNWLLANEVKEDEVDFVLKKFAQLMDVERASLFLLEEDDETKEKKYIKKHEWNVGKLSDIDQSCDVYNCSSSADSIIHELFLNNEVLVANIDEIKETRLKDKIKKQGTKSLAYIPIYRDKDFSQVWGFVGFEDFKRERWWSDFEINILRVLGNLIQWIYEKVKSNRRLYDLGKEAEKLIHQQEEVRGKLDLYFERNCIQTTF